MKTSPKYYVKNPRLDCFHGPFDLEEIKGQAADGRITSDFETVESTGEESYNSLSRKRDWKRVGAAFESVPFQAPPPEPSQKPPDAPSSNDTRERRARLLAKVYYVMLGLAVLFGLLGGAMMRSGGGKAGDPIAILTFFIVFPAFVLADSAFRAQLLFCPLRAVSLPLVEGFVIWRVADWQDPFAISVMTAFVYAIGSFIVAAIARARKRPTAATSLKSNPALFGDERTATDIDRAAVGDVLQTSGRPVQARTTANATNPTVTSSSLSPVFVASLVGVCLVVLMASVFAFSRQTSDRARAEQCLVRMREICIGALV